MPKRYAREFRRDICERLVAGERISKVSSETDISPATLHRWRDQALIDAGLVDTFGDGDCLVPGVTAGLAGRIERIVLCAALVPAEGELPATPAATAFWTISNDTRPETTSR